MVMKRWLGVVFSVLPIAACTNGGHDESRAASLLAKAQAPYNRNYTHTTCGEFEHRLSPAERTAAATIALARLREDDGLPGPSDQEVDEFVASIEGTCEARGRSSTLVSAAVFAYQH